MGTTFCPHGVSHHEWCAECFPRKAVDSEYAEHIAAEIVYEFGVPATEGRTVAMLAYAFARGAHVGYMEAARDVDAAFGALRDELEAAL